MLPITFEALVSIFVCWVLPAVLYTFMNAHRKEEEETGRRLFTTGEGGKEVPMDVERRKEAEKMEGKKITDRKLQALCVLYFVVPYLWAWQTQENPTASEQVSTWLQQSWSQLADHQVTLHFQLAFVALLSERLCYTWVHTFSPSFVRFCNTRLGQFMGRLTSPKPEPRPLDTVLCLFYINKTIQLGTFLS